MNPEEQIIDACLSELIGSETPPDLTRQILLRLPGNSPVEEPELRSHPSERIIEAGLEELLGGVAPADTERWSEELAARLALGSESAESKPLAAPFQPTPPPLPHEQRSVGAVSAAGAAGAVSPDEPIAPPLPTASMSPASPAVSIRSNSPHRRGRRRQLPWLLAATSAVALLAVGLVYWRGGVGMVAEMADRQPPPSEPIEESTAEPAPPVPPAAPSIAGDDVPSLDPFNESLFPIDGLFVNTEDDQALTLEDEADVESALSSREALADDEVIRVMNQLLARSWREEGVATVPAADDQWCRRLYLQLLGRIPTVDELQAFAADERPDKAQQWIRMLQDGEQHADEYAGHWAAVWASLLVGQRGGMAEDDVASREDLERYLSESIRADKPYDQMVRELISATGSARPSGPDYNPATNFLLASMDDGGEDKNVLATARTFEVFHHRQVKCVQCHAHPTDDAWSQRDFWSLNAFFRQMRLRNGQGGPALVNEDFAGEGPGGIDEAEVFFEQLNGETAAALPAYPGREVDAASGRLSKVDRRKVLADLVTTDPQLARAAVNRLWSHFHGYGFTKPVNDMGSHRPVSHPELLELLAKQFRLSGYSFDRLVRWVAASDGFSRSSQMTLATSGDEPEAGSRPLFSRYYTRQLPPEVVYDSLAMVAATGQPRSLEGRADWLGQFIQPMGTDEGQELSTFGNDVRQSLIIMNGPLMRRATNSRNQDGLLHEVVQSDVRLAEKVERLFLAAVARKPTRRELASVRGLLEEQGGEGEAEVLEAVWWALLNSNEFILDH